MPMGQQLTDAHGRVAGRIVKRTGGRFELRDHTGRTIGSYDPRTDGTENRTGRSFGKGSLLAALLIPK